MSTKICARVFYQSGTVWVFSVLGLIFFFPSVTPAAVSLDEESGSSQAAEPTSQEEMPAVYQLDPMVDRMSVV